MADKKARVLVVDDESFYTEVLQNLLHEEYEIALAATGGEALEYMAEQGADLVLLDIILPDIDGYEVCRRLMQDPKTEDVPVIFLTAKDDVDDEVKGFNLGAVDYITKPISPPIVRARVAVHLKMASLIRQLEGMVEKLKN
jgi:putative two-component system response regulator